MKKIIAIALALLMLVGCVAALSACKKKDTSKVKVVDIGLTEEKYAFAVKKGDAELLGKLKMKKAEELMKNEEFMTSAREEAKNVIKSFLKASTLSQDYTIEFKN